MTANHDEDERRQRHTDEGDSVGFVMRGLLHDFANLQVTPEAQTTKAIRISK